MPDSVTKTNIASEQAKIYEDIGEISKISAPGGSRIK
jgi:hypothetical protein